MKKIGVLIFLACTAHCCIAQTTLPENVVESIQKRIDIGWNPSVAIGIVDNMGMHYFSYGLTGTKGQPVDEHTIYEIGSVSKTFTAILLADMVEKGKMHLDDPAQEYLPSSVRLPRQDDRQITLGELSDHTSGLPRMPDNLTPADPLNPYADYTVDQMYAFLSSYQLTRDIGSEYEYSNLAQGLLGHILALRAGTDYETLMRNTIAEPLGMNETRVVFTKQMKKHLARPYAQGTEVVNWDIPTLAGAGGIRSSVYDLCRYIAANMGVLPSPLYSAMQMTHVPRHDKAGHEIGLAWQISNGTDGKIIWHNGLTGGYTCFVGFVQEDTLGVVVLTNSDASVDDIGFHLLEPASPLRSVKRHVATELQKIIDTEGLAHLDEKFQALKSVAGDTLDFNEVEINRLGYDYLGRGNVDAALALFKINTIEYPASSNVWDSYAEGLMEKGDTVAAIENYRRSLKMNPGNTNAVEMLGRMGVTVEPAEVTVGTDILESYVGKYELYPGFILTVSLEGEKLYGQATGQQRFEMFAKSETEFYLKVTDAQVVFNKNDDGSIKSLTLHQNGQDIEGKKME